MMTLGEEHKGSGMGGNKPDIDYYELFCAQARSPTGRRRKLSSCEYGGSLPCLPDPQEKPAPRGHPLLARAHAPLGPTRSTDAHLSVPGSPHTYIRRTRSHYGAEGRPLSGALSPVSPLALSPCASPHNLSPLASPRTGSPRAGSPLNSPRSPGKKSRSSKLWSSFKSLVDSCEGGSPKCISPDMDNPPYSPIGGAPVTPVQAAINIHVAVHKCSSAPNSRNPSLRRKKKTRNVSESATVDDDVTHTPPSSSSSSSRHRRNNSYHGNQHRSRGGHKRPTLLKLEKVNTLSPGVGGGFWEGEGSPGEDRQRVRNLVTTPKGILNCGDSFRSKSPCSLGGSSLGSSREEVCSIGSASSLIHGEGQPHTYKVLIMGAPGSGKTTLSQQFGTSESVVEKESMYNESALDDCISVTVQLDEEEALLSFIELRSEEDIRLLPDFDGYVVVYSMTDRHSFHQAMDALYNIRQEDQTGRFSVILVANKSDLVRSREIASQEGQSAAGNYNSKYIEVSALMNLKVDELLAGIVNQIRLRERPGYRQRLPSNHSGRKSPMRLINRILKRQCAESKSCENLNDI